MPEHVIGTTAEGRLIVLTQVGAPSSYPAGGFTVTISSLSLVEFVLSAYSSGGYIVEAIPSGTSNVVTVRIYSSGGTEVASGTDLSAETVTLVTVGY